MGNSQNVDLVTEHILTKTGSIMGFEEEAARERSL